MSKIKNTNEALKMFEESTVTHAECTENGNYKVGNKAFAKILKAVDFLKKHNQLLELERFFSHKLIGPKLAAAVHLLSISEKGSLDVLKKIASGSPSHARLSAKSILKQWSNPDSDLRKRFTRWG